MILRDAFFKTRIIGGFSSMDALIALAELLKAMEDFHQVIHEYW